jgi:apolipoprotein N-acyltransferase
VLAVCLAGIGFILAFPPPDLGFVAWVALVPLFLATHHRASRAAFWLGYMWGLVAFGGVLWWTTTFGPLVWVLVTVLSAVFPGLAMLAIAWVERDHDGPFVFLWIALLWTAVEFLRSQGPLGFPWALLGASQHQAVSIIQVASLTGIFGVSFLVVLVNATLYVLLTRRAIVIPVCGTGLMLAATILWGVSTLRPPVPATFTAAVIQPGFDVRLRWHPPLVDRERELAVLRQLTHDAAKRGATLVVWPETASPLDILGTPAVLGAVQSWARDDHLSLIATSLEGGQTNSAFAFAPSGALTGRYDKVRLVPFAEHGERPGRAYAVLRTPEARIGVMVCFESIFPQIARRYARQGADLLAVITNDAWFDGRTAPAQHAAVAPFRAVEEGRYLLRAANDGISAIIDPRGRTLNELPLGEHGVLMARVAALSKMTLYARYGDVFGWAAAAVGVVLLLPRTLAFVAEEAGTAAFSRLLIDSALPLLTIAGVVWLRGPARVHVGPVALPLPMLALLLVTAILSMGRSLKELGFQAKGFIPALVSGLAAVGALALVARHAFATQGALLPILAPPGGWWGGAAVQVLVVGLALEWWLRGLVFADAVSWRGWRLAVLWSALLGMVAASPRGAEAMVWGLCAGLAFGLIRARWTQVPALAVAHGLGNTILGFLISPW